MLEGTQYTRSAKAHSAGQLTRKNNELIYKKSPVKSNTSRLLY